MAGTAAKRPADAPMMGGSGKKLKGFGKGSFAQRMMAKMGHVKGEGLGKGGEGIVNPIEVKLRPQGVGVGAVKEMTPQAKAEAKRVAERRGETYQDSSDEERHTVGRRNKHQTNRVSGASTTRPPSSRPKLKVRTAAEIEVEDGLAVPDIFKTLVDHTGPQPKQISSGSGIFTTAVDSSRATEADKILHRARVELEAFADAWRELKDRDKYLDFQEVEAEQVITQLIGDESREHQLDLLVDEIQALGASTKANERSLDALYRDAEALLSKMEQAKPRSSTTSDAQDLSDVAVASFFPIFKRIVDEWIPLEDSKENAIPMLRRLKACTGPSDLSSALKDNMAADSDDELQDQQSSHQLSAYDSMFFTIWFPKVRTAIVSQWNAHHPSSALHLLEQWREILPTFLFRMVVDSLITHKLLQAIKPWRPSRSGRHKHTQPHQWIFPWLEYLDQYHLDPQSSDGVLAEMKRKYRSALEVCDLVNGTVDGLDQWRDLSVMKPELDKQLQVKILPRLTHHIRDELHIDPTDQDLSPVWTILKWLRYFSWEKFARVLVAGFFSQSHSVLHHWLIGQPDYDEIGRWLTWWQSVFPPHLNEQSVISVEWRKALDLINQALDLGLDDARKGLPQSATEAGAQRASDFTNQQTTTNLNEPSEMLQVELSMRDILEELCEEENVLLVPLRKFHPQTGLPLLKVTASASGAGGTVVHIKEDAVWAQSRRDRNLWEPVDVFAPSNLSNLAEPA